MLTLMYVTDIEYIYATLVKKIKYHSPNATYSHAVHPHRPYKILRIRCALKSLVSISSKMVL